MAEFKLRRLLRVEEAQLVEGAAAARAGRNIKEAVRLLELAAALGARPSSGAQKTPSLVTTATATTTAAAAAVAVGVDECEHTDRNGGGCNPKTQTLNPKPLTLNPKP